ncbi:MAG: nucleoside-diphosphate-sugar pyrophosphorylase [Candidatus Altarchaeum sp. CG12_big_fil_rev_8_21_14_0_65_33_22]|nr:MAG: nucleoside-diphosphate-sugar pyrophosphorylase [Candidatus Altarchaeum sp. CG2_30_32_3053]PIN68177.1 MAG: nucleoside-diphosphate-sugar pyrophosphorylase [Candidatus Altarchaeum sp. CG12_big_fil_rev_8_21_14_0_65_33_22]
MKAVILAGGEGRRLKPFTYVIPKPLMPIGELPIIEIILKQLKNNGFNDIIISTGYKENLIRMFLNGADKKHNLNIKYSHEDKPLGTVGSLSLIKDELNEDFILMNGDTLCTVNYNELMKYHKKSGNIATITLHKKEIKINFGVVKLDNVSIIDYIEKPTHTYFVSIGVYVFKPDVLKYIPDGKLDFPDLIKILIRNNEKVGGYIFDDYWQDIGRQEDYMKANEDINKIYDKLGIGVNTR